MALMRLSSSNPDLSYVIFKNPLTQSASRAPFSRPFRKGLMLGWFSTDNQSFCLYFRDSTTESSFATGVDATFEYLDRSRYASPFFPVAAISTLLSTTQKVPQQKDTEHVFDHALVVPTVKLGAVKLADRLSACFPAFATTITPVGTGGALYAVTIRTSVSLHALLNYALVFFLLQSVVDREVNVDANEESVRRALTALNVLGAPYYPRYVLVSRMIGSENVFNAVKPLLEAPGNMTFHYGNTRQQRFAGVQKLLSGGDQLLDLGCGELFFARKLAKKYTRVLAVDHDPDLPRYAAHRGVPNIETRVGDLRDEASLAGITPSTDVLLTEVLEHLEPTDAHTLLTRLARLSPRKIVVTVPNRAFNDQYDLGGGFRHDDHKWEPTRSEFQSLLSSAFAGWTQFHQGLGDWVGDQSVSLLAVLTPPGSPSPPPVCSTPED